MNLPQEVTVDGNSLTIKDVAAVARHKINTCLTSDPQILRLIEESRKFYLASGILAYGDGMGVGANVGKIIPKEKRRAFQPRLINSLSCGIGDELAPEISRGAMLLRANSLIKMGCSAIGLDKIQKIIELLNADVIPVMYEDGSVCASGDLVPLSSIAQVIQGRGRVWYKGRMRKTRLVFSQVGITPLTLAEKEGLSIVNGTSVSTAMAALAIYEAEYLIALSMFCEALAIEALEGMTDHLDGFVHEVKNHQGQRYAATTLNCMLQDSLLTKDIDDLRAKVSKIAGDSARVIETKIELQDPYSLRCAPQIFGPTLELVEKVIRPWIEQEMNSANDNPIVNLEHFRVHHTGNFSGFYVALGMDTLKLAMFNIADLLHALKSRMLNERYNRDLGASLAGTQPGFNSGFKGVDIGTTDIFGKICFLAGPMSIHRRATESNNQDVVSFGFAAAERALELNEEYRRLLAVTLIILAQAVDKRSGGAGEARRTLAPKTKEIYEQIRGKVKYLTNDRPLQPDIDRILIMLRAHEIAV
ncbi:MAG: aromatic amino acid lyase [Candidatus Yanofskybacteria bacterium]|nr:aromatic amino acid lyase [Candidatus Yanofskybacteria bacterium]